MDPLKGTMRIQKFLAMSGVASRRKGERMVTEGRVTVNGKTVTEPGFLINPGKDRVFVDGKRARFQPYQYVMLHKPAGVVTTASDQFGRKTVMDLLTGLSGRLYPVGRLDYDTSGLLLLTNDGDLAFRLTHPKHEISKVYEAKVQNAPAAADVQRFCQGLAIEDYVTAPAGLEILSVQTAAGPGARAKNSLLRVSIHEGRNRQVRKMCQAIGCPVIRLKRVQEGNLRLGDLAEGAYRQLTEDEVEGLRRL